MGTFTINFTCTYMNSVHVSNSIYFVIFMPHKLSFHAIIRSHLYMRHFLRKSNMFRIPTVISHCTKMDVCYKGRKYRFLYPLAPDFICSLCSHIVVEAQRTICGHLYCKQCLYQATRGQRGQCTACGSTLTPPFFSNDSRVDNQVKNLEVRCPNSPCSLTGSLVDVEDHVEARCIFQRISCPNQGCDFASTRAKVDEHRLMSCPYRQCSCRYCKTPCIYNLLPSHYHQCPSYPLSCPYGCPQFNIPREEMDNHLKVCPEQLVQCPFYTFGCRTHVARRKLKFHEEEDKNAHLRLSVSHVVELSQTVNNLQTLSQLAPSQNTPTQQSAYSQTRQSLFMPRQTGEGHSSTEDRVLHASQQDPTWLCNTALFPSMPWIVKMDKFEENRAVNVDWTSPPVFTDPTGYKFTLTVNAFGSILPGYISIYLALMRGPCDNILQWPCKRTIRVSLLNQQQDDGHHSIIIDYKDVPSYVSTQVEAYNFQRGTGWGKDEFVSHDELERRDNNCQYLKNNCLFFKIEQMVE